MPEAAMDREAEPWPDLDMPRPRRPRPPAKEDATRTEILRAPMVWSPCADHA
jgi:hypothetical protein